MNKEIVLTQLQLDALRELGNIGSGNAATALSQFINKRIDMEVPEAKILPFNEVPNYLGNPEQEILGIFLKVMGKFTGRFLLLIPISTAFKLLNILLAGYEITYQNRKFGEIETSCLKEVGNILAGAFLNALSNITHTLMLNSLPSLAVDMLGALLDSVIADMVAVSDSVLLLEAAFLESQENLRINIILIPDPQSLELLLETLGVK